MPNLEEKLCMAPKDIYERKEVHPEHEILLTYCGIAITLIASTCMAAGVIRIFARAVQAHHPWGVVEQCIFLAIVTFLIYGSLLYQMTRVGYFKRLRLHCPELPGELDAAFAGPEPPPLTILIPSYKEEIRVIRQALLSAALQSYPVRRVVLLIDDPPDPAPGEDRMALAQARQLPHQIEAQLGREAQRFESARIEFQARRATGLDLWSENVRCLQQVERAANWFEHEAQTFAPRDHTDRWFVEITFTKRARQYRERKLDLEARLQGAGPLLHEAKLEREYRRLAALFRVEVTSFERKRFENLSHEPNKAMNLNSYLALLGHSFREEHRNAGVVLVPAPPAASDLHVPDAEYLVTLDADSLLDPDYALRLVSVMTKPENHDVAVLQTPYSAVPGPPGTLERIAGATTDLQYLIHQGFTRSNATFWVGANALLRRRALEDIRTDRPERGYRISRFIQDRTVIEDTESSVDLIRSGWRLHNFPERLSYSATPQDFGSILIQRGRWANGGLLILPKLFGYLARAPRSLQTLCEGVMRFHYLSSTTAVNIGTLILLLYPFEENLRDFWLPLSAVPYFFFYGRDLIQAGYAFGDLVRIYALNLMLIPINLGGVLRSIDQGLTGKRIPFQRTPKICGRTTAPARMLLAEYLLTLYASVGAVVDALTGRWLHAFFSSVTAAALLYAVVRLIGLKAAREDLALSRRQPHGPPPAGEKDVESPLQSSVR